VGKRLEWLETPAVTVDLDILEANLRRKAELARKAGVKLRPHTKTHKSVEVARMQLQLGAAGITVAKLGEAEVMAAAGIDDILIAYPIIGEAKLARLARLMEKAKVIVSTDDEGVAAGLSGLGVSLGRRIPLYIDVDSGLGRCGLAPGEETALLVERVAKLPGVEVTGLMTHGGHAYGEASEEGSRRVALEEAESLLTTQEWLRKKGLAVREISVGSTPTSKFVAEVPGVTEMRPGAYVYGDVSQLATETIGLDGCALRVYATVISRPRPGVAIIDAGSKTLTKDANAHHPGYGLLPDWPDVVVEGLSEEHGHLRVPADWPVPVGGMVEIVPNHCCAVVNLHDRLIGLRGDRYSHDIVVDARGKIS
jgi:D-serine deaminase-like pyridoxal phosphate-dependent protein